MAKPKSQVTESKAIEKVQQTTSIQPAWMQEAMAEANAEAAKFQQGISRITFSPQGVVIDGEVVEGGKLPVVIVEAIFGKAYYPGAYNPKVPAMPTCYAFHPDDPAAMVPHSAVPDKQHDACKGCPHNVFGTALVGNGKRCKDEVRLMCAVYKPDEDITQGEFRMASVPPGSLKIWGNYVKSLRDNGRRYGMVVTELASNPLQGGGFNVTFKAVTDITEAQFKAFQGRRASAREEMMQPYPVLEEAQQTPPQKSGKRKF